MHGHVRRTAVQCVSVLTAAGGYRRTPGSEATMDGTTNESAKRKRQSKLGFQLIPRDMPLDYYYPADDKAASYDKAASSSFNAAVVSCSSSLLRSPLRSIRIPEITVRRRGV
jgi:hypothetical protein